MEIIGGNCHTNPCAPAYRLKHGSCNFFRSFKLEHPLESSVNYRLIRRLPHKTVIERVLVDSEEVAFSRDHGFLSFEIEAHGASSFAIQLDVTPVDRARHILPGSGIKQP